MAAPQAGHQERGSHTGLVAAVLGCIPVTQPEVYLVRQRSQQMFRDSPSEAAESQTFPRNLPRLSSLLSCRESGVSRNFAVHLTMCVHSSTIQRLPIHPALQEFVESPQNAAQCRGEKVLVFELLRFLWRSQAKCSIPSPSSFIYLNNDINIA